MEESNTHGEDRSYSASNSTLTSHGAESPKDETVVSEQSEARNASRSQTPVNSSDTNNALEQTYFYGGYVDGAVNWGENSNYVHANNMQVMPPIYNDNSSLMFPAYGLDPQMAYGPFSPIANPLSPIVIDGQLYSPQQVPLSPSYYSRPVSPTGFATSTSSGQEGFGDNVFWGCLHYPVNNSFGFYNGPSDFGQLTTYNMQEFISGSSGVYEASRLNHQRVDKEVKNRDPDSVNLTSDSHATTTDRNRGPRASKPKGSKSADHTSNHTELYNRPDFSTTYEKAKFFVIKSFNEDNVHRSIKYGVWASTPLGNRKLDAAYQEAKKDEDSSPVFLFYSVNASGQFCGVAEMIGAVDFENDADYWQLDRWSGQFRVQWHIIKDVPNSRFRHILLENNDHKPVTHSRNSQEMNFEEGIAMLKIFKEHDSGTSILDDFSFYDEREKSFQEKQAKEHVSTKDSVVDASINELSDRVADSLQLEKHKEI